MAHDVFISHASQDKAAADATCAALEAPGISCWLASRDIVPSADWGASIVKAIAGAKVFLLIFSASANASPHVTREVERAVNRGAADHPGADRAGRAGRLAGVLPQHAALARRLSGAVRAAPRLRGPGRAAAARRRGRGRAACGHLLSPNAAWHPTRSRGGPG